MAKGKSKAEEARADWQVVDPKEEVT